MEFHKAEKIKRDFVCARCYGELAIDADREGGGFIVLCMTCKDAWNGAKIRRSSAVRLGQDYAIKARKIKRNMSDLFDEEKQSVEQNLKDLGF